jgi:hypothetical protein
MLIFSLISLTFVTSPGTILQVANLPEWFSFKLNEYEACAPYFDDILGGRLDG